MKTTALTILALLGLGTLSAQEEEKNESRIETIKIINGDTVLHDVRIVDASDISEKRARHRERLMEISSEDLSEEIDQLLEDIDVYVNLDDGKKRMIIKRMEMTGEDMEEMVKDWETGSDMLIDMNHLDNQIKVIRIDIDEESGEEVKRIEVEKRRDKKHSAHADDHPPMGKYAKRGLHVFPNPSNGEINLNFEVGDSPVELKVIDVNGKEVFSKTYKEGGQVSEKIELKKNQKGVHIISLNDKERSIKKKIIIE